MGWPEGAHQMEGTARAQAQWQEKPVTFESGKAFWMSCKDSDGDGEGGW